MRGHVTQFKIQIWVALLALISTNAFGQEELFNMTIEELLQVEITSVSKKKEGHRTAPAMVEVITADEIRRRGYSDLEQLLHDLSGMDISRGNGTNYSTFYMRGYRSNNPDRTLLLIDGVEENDLWSGTAWISRQYPLSNIKRVEVVYGPASTMYGANAFLGVINVITKEPSELIRNGKRFGISAQTGYGTWNTRYMEATGVAKFGKVSMTVTGRVFESDEMDLSGYPDWDYRLSSYGVDYYKNLLHTSNDSANWARMQDSAVYYRADKSTKGRSPVYGNHTHDWLVHSKLKIEDFTVGFQYWQISEGYGAWYRDDYETGTKNGGQWAPANLFTYAQYEKKLSSDFSIQSLTSFRSHQISPESRSNYFMGYFNGSLTRDSLDQHVEPRWDINRWFVMSKQFRTELRFQYTPSIQWDFVGGVEFRNSLIQGDYVKGPDPHADETGLPVDPTESGIPGGNHYENRDVGFYAQTDYQPVEAWRFFLGGRVDHNEIRSTGGFGTVFNPRAAVVWTPSPFIVKTIYSEAFKDANNFSKFSTTQGRRINNPTLEPERVRNFEGSVGWQISKNVFCEAGGYRSTYSDIIGTATVRLPDSSTTTQHQAIGALAIHGIQAKMYAGYQNYSAWLNYTYTHGTNTDDDVPIGDIARHHVNAGFDATWFSKLEFDLRVNYVGERRTGQGTTIKDNPRDHIGAYTVVNTVLGYGPLVKGLSIQCIVNNVFDAEYFDPGVRSADGEYYASRLPQNRRNIMLRALYEF